ncbi:STAS domain-containing protein [Actinosynnema sp. CS-041913]|uniref:STAS domain-containing protein n=1 Tax=Actinosynnema sp. CS-041913 TaxID=3239917 RepID=UPI003D9056BF
MEDFADAVELSALDHIADTVVIEVSGEIDMATAPCVIDFLRAHLPAAGRTLVLDLTKVTFFGSAGINVLLTLHSEVEPAGVRLRVVASTPAVLRPLEVTDLLRVFAVTSSVTDVG